ncbi:MAG TPA: ABC transporter ATP-binding protein/permease [Candidatus Gallimonas gallistercoris]|mgnify:FL=1|uniref:ABC transporter ATP-binding protein/permease n=1 Tax=Candidatus Gallimonas gallistercoris TaxID=2838602 RepID=A0A9D2KGM2_9FIRM|nr:ABC transporter ATP-binding protein/permease [Candidatus Gallimonas gallistercoris]
MKRIRKRPEGTFRGILGYLKPYSLFLVCTVVCAVVYVASTLVVPYLAGLAIDCMAGANEVDYPRLYALFAAIGVSIALTALSQWLMSLSNNHIAYRVLADIRRDAFRKLGVLPLKYLDGRSYGKTASVVITDAEQFSDGLLLGFTQLFTGAATILGVLVILFVLRWEVALVVLCVTPLSLFVAKFIASHTYSMFKKQAATRAEQTGFIDEMIGNLKIVKAFSHEGENEEKFDEINERLRACSLRAIFYSSTTNPGTRLVNNIVYALVALVGAFLVIATAGAAVPFTVGNLSSVLSYATQYTKPFNEITEVITEFQNALACAARLFALIGEEEQPSDEGNIELTNVKGEVRLSDVGFSYDPEKPLIEHLNVLAPAGKRVAIVGPTGCGKTTLINLLMRFYDVDKGCVSVDGHDIREITRKSLRSHYGMVLQETWLKKATVRENLLMGNPEATEEEMIEAARAAHAHGFISRLPEGYDTVIGDEGALSQGQRQLLCIARIMLTRPPMLILDEATSSIDTRTEMRVQDAFQKLMQGRTCFIVAHRLSTIENADLILVMKAGTIIEQGTHKELLQKGGFYSELYKAQFAG